MTSLEIQRRHFRYYLRVLNQADILYCEGGEALESALKAARALNDRVTEAVHLGNIGIWGVRSEHVSH